MPLSPSKLLKKVLIGNDAGWILSFHKESTVGGATVSVSGDQPFEIGRDDYYAEISASLPNSLEGGVYRFVIEGLTDEHYKKIVQMKGKDSLVVKLYLFWRDTNASAAGYMKNVASLTDTVGVIKSEDVQESLVAVLNILSISRKAGTRRYETTIIARERVFDILTTRRLCASLDASDLLTSAEAVASNNGIEVSMYPFSEGNDQAQSSENQGTENQELEEGVTLLETLQELGRRLEEKTGKYGRKMFLIRNGKLHIGNRRFPLDGEPLDLTLSNGLIEIETLEPLKTDPNFDHCADQDKQPPQRRQFKLTCKGRPDIKPGEMVRFVLPDEEVETTRPGVSGVVGDLVKGPLIPSLGDLNFENQNPVKIYVISVDHKLGRTSSFKTTVMGVEVKGSDQDEVWDTHTRRNNEAESEEPAGGNGEERVAQAVRRRVQRTIESRRFPEVGEVRGATVRGTEEPPRQTLTVWRGLQPADGRSNQARRLDIVRPSPAPATGVPYTTPFAWGKCGLVLPRYPGTRVLVTHRNGHRNDPVEIGALWESANGPDSEPGDWWLLLPVGVPADRRVNIAGSEPPEEHNGKVTQDLIDADGNRIIEVGELTVNVLPQNMLKDAGQRPEHGKHVEGGASIIIKPDGSVVIKAKKIEFDAGDGEIALKAKNVNVQVSDSMNVS